MLKVQEIVEAALGRAHELPLTPIQLCTLLAIAIDSEGRWGRPVPFSCRYGAARLKVSKNTVQLALNQLVSAGWLKREPGQAHGWGTWSYLPTLPEQE